MTLRTISAFGLAGIFAVSALAAIAQDVPTEPNPALASLSVEEMVEQRQALMREDGGLLRQAGTLSGQQAVDAARKLAVNFTDFPALFPEGSIAGDSRALPVIWQDWEKFTGYFAQAREHSIAAMTAAQAGDDAGFRAALQPIGQLCGQCHQEFRGD